MMVAAALNRCDGSVGANCLPPLPLPNPYTAGPTSNVWPLLLLALCSVVLWFYRNRLNAQRIAAAWLTAADLIVLAQYLSSTPSLSPWISQPQAGEAFANLRQRTRFATLTSIGLLALIG